MEKLKVTNIFSGQDLVGSKYFGQIWIKFLSVSDPVFVGFGSGFGQSPPRSEPLERVLKKE